MMGKSDKAKTILECIRRLEAIGVHATIHNVPLEAFEELGFTNCFGTFIVQEIMGSTLYSENYMGWSAKRTPSDIPKKLRDKIEDKLGMPIEAGYEAEKEKDNRRYRASHTFCEFSGEFIYAVLRLITSGGIDDEKARDCFHKVGLDWDYYKKNAAEFAAKLGPRVGIGSR